MLAVDDHASFLALLGQLLRVSGELELLATAGSGEQAISMADELRPNVVVMDIRLPGIDGIQAAKQIKTKHPSTLVILISTTPPEELPREAADARADAILWKSDLDPARLDEIWVRYRKGSLPSVG